MTDVHTARSVWTSWHGTPAWVAQIARDAQRTVHDSGRGPVTIAVAGDAWSHGYGTIESFETEIRATDLPDVERVRIEVESDDRLKTVTVELLRRGRPEPGSSGSNVAAKLLVAGDSREWVEETMSALRETISARSTYPVTETVTLVAGLLLLSAGLIALGTHHGHLARVVGIGLIAAGVIAITVGFAALAVRPSFELLPNGGQSWRQLVADRVKAEGRWLFRQTIGGLIGFVVGALVVALWK